MSSVDGGGGSGAWISRGFSAEAPLALSSGDSWGNLDNGFSLIDASSLRRAGVGDPGTSALCASVFVSNKKV